MGGIGITKIKTNVVTDKLRSGQPAVGSWLGLCSPVAAESMARVGFDWLVVDAEHSPVGFDTMVKMFRAIQLGGAAPMARVPWNDTIWIQRTLDAGALGLVVPMVNSAADAKSVVANMKYATKGQRSFGGSRVASYIDGDYRTWTDENLAVIVMIETAEAVEHAEEIMAVEGVVGCFIGPNDLALSMGLTPAQVGPGTAHEAAMMKVLEACKKTGKAAGKHCFTMEELNLRIAQGYQFLALCSDVAFMTKEATAAFKGIDWTGGSGAAGAAKTKGTLY